MAFNGLKVKKLSENAKIPTRGDPGAAGLDLYSASSGEIPPLTRKLIKTNISMKIPEGHYGRVAPRSGLAYKFGIDTLAGVCDATYRGDIGVILFNTDTEKTFKYEKHERIAQLVIEKIMDNFELEEVDELDETERGSGGFGSTGTK